MSVFASPRFLRNVMLIDAASCLATGALQVLLHQPLSELLRLPAALLSGTGWFLVVYAAVAAVVATREPVPRLPVTVIAIGNFAWAAGCLLLLVAGGLRPSVLGVGWIVAQVLTVLALAELQWMGLRRQAQQGWA